MNWNTHLFLVILALPIAVTADLGVIDDQNQQYALYRLITPADGQQARKDNVFMVKCEGEPVALTRNCGSNTENVTTYTEFSRNVQALYGVPAGYGGRDGIERITQNIEELSRELDGDDLPGSEIERLKSQKSNLTRLQRKLIRLNQVIFSKLDKENSGFIDQNYGVDLAGGGNAERLKSAFMPVWFDGTSKIWKLAKIGGDYYAQMRICKPPFRGAMVADYEHSLGTASTMRFLAQSAIGSYPIIGSKTVLQRLAWAADKPEFDKNAASKAIATAIDLIRESTVRDRKNSQVDNILAIFCVMDWNEEMP